MSQVTNNGTCGCGQSGSLAGLQAALAHGYCHDACHAAHDSIHSASIAIAEASYIEQLILKFKGLSSTVAAQQVEIASHLLDMESLKAAVDVAVSKAKEYADMAKAAADKGSAGTGSGTGTGTGTSVDSDQLVQLLEAIGKAEELMNDIAAAKDAAEEAADEARMSQDAAASSLTSTTLQAGTASAAATEAAKAQGAAEQAKADAVAAARRADEAAEQAARIEERLKAITPDSTVSAEYVAAVEAAANEAKALAEEAIAAVEAASVRAPMLFMGVVSDPSLLDTDVDNEQMSESVLWYAESDDSVRYWDGSTWAKAGHDSLSGTVRFTQIPGEYSSNTVSAVASSLKDGSLCYVEYEDGSAGSVYVSRLGRLVKISSGLTVEDVEEILDNTYITAEVAEATYVSKTEVQQASAITPDPMLSFEAALAGFLDENGNGDTDAYLEYLESLEQN